MDPSAVCLLEDWGVLRIAGPDARRFLQGQLSNDVAALPPGTLLRAGLHTPQGRTLALLALVAESDTVLLALLPRALIEATASTLHRYVLRARVAIADASADYRIDGLLQAAPPQDGALSVDYQGERQLRIGSRAAVTPPAQALPHAAWRALDIAAGLPQIYPSTSGQFVAQMLNLDCIGAISFTKGCYTGQEVIARAHYRGRVKRRMQRFVTDTKATLAPGDAAQLSDGRSVRIVDAVERPDGRTEFLAVAALPAGPAEAAAGGPISGETISSEAASGETGAALEASTLPLPYDLPQ